MAKLIPLPYSQKRYIGYSDRFHDFSVTIPRCYKDAYFNSFFRRLARPWNSLSIECFPLTFGLNLILELIHTFYLLRRKVVPASQKMIFLSEQSHSFSHQ